MTFDLQRANMWKRASAFILDAILIVIFAAGAMLGLSAITGYNDKLDQLDAYYAEHTEKILAEYDIEKLNITLDEFNNMSEEEQKNHENAVKAFETALNNDKEVVATYQMVVTLSMTITSVGIFFAFAVLELIVPLILKNGQTIGKKAFGLCLMRVDGVKVTTLMMFVRSILGKYTVETMIPVLIIIMLIFNSIGIVGIAVLVMMLILQLGLLFVTKNHTMIHDTFAQTVEVDMASQKIFDSAEELTAYKAKLAAEIAAKESYR